MPIVRCDEFETIQLNKGYNEQSNQCGFSEIQLSNWWANTCNSLVQGHL